MRQKGYYFMRILALFFIITALCGCTILKGVSENISGNYMGGLERTRQNSKSQIFDYRVGECFDKALTILKSGVINVKILKVDIYNYSILISVSRPSMQENMDSKFDGDNADVGLFFTEVGQTSTKVEINSFSSPFRDYTAKKIFLELQK